MQRLLLWRGLDAWRAEAAAVDLAADGLRATGTQLGVDPLPYRLDYALDAGERFVTRTLQLESTGEGWKRRLRLTHDGAGGWRCEASEQGTAPLPPAGGDVGAVAAALDCDLGFSPLTNTLPIRRRGLHEHAVTADFLMAWVSVPDLGLHPSRQQYEHVRRDGDVSVVRYVGEHRTFTSELELDRDGFVLVYPQLARRVRLSAADTPPEREE
jgi:uncharacterized protein